MKNKLELKHLVGYSSYGVKMTNGCIIDGIVGNRVFIDDGDSFYWITDIKPILHPLSDLTKEIEVNGKKFVPYVKLAEIEFQECSTFDKYVFDEADAYPLSGNRYIEFIDSGNDCIQIVFSTFMQSFVFFNITQKLKITPCLYNKEMFQKLLEWHFDIHGLIKEGLAIDINTLKS